MSYRFVTNGDKVLNASARLLFTNSDQLDKKQIVSGIPFTLFGYVHDQDGNLYKMDSKSLATIKNAQDAKTKAVMTNVESIA